jgi:hypothetical protein
MNGGPFLFGRLTNSTTAASRVYPLILPQSPTFPAVTYQQISAVRMHAMGQDSPLVRVRVQVDSWGKTYAEARTLAAEVEARLKRHSGQYGAVKVHDVLLDNELELYDSDTQTRRVSQDYTLFLSTGG